MDPKPLNRPAQLVLRSIISLSLAFTMLWIALYFKPGLAILPFASKVKHSPFCSTWQAVEDIAVKFRQADIEKEIQSETRYIRSENGYKLWSTPSGEFWAPDTSDGILQI